MFNDPSVNQYMLEGLDEIIHYNTDVEYSQQFGTRFQLVSHLAYGSETYRFTDPFRIHQLYGEAILSGHQVKLGRLAVWSPLVNKRFDGVDYSMSAGKLGSIQLGGGMVPDYSGTQEDETFFNAGWGKTNSGSKISAQMWGSIYDNDESIKAGFTFSTRLFSRLKLAGHASWDISEGEAYYNRIKISQQFGKHQLGLTLSHRNYNLKRMYPFLSEDLWVSPTASVFMRSKVNESISLINQFRMKFTDESSWAYSLTATTSHLQVMLMTSTIGANTLMGGNVSLSGRLTGKISYGGSVAINTVELDANVDTKESFGVYGWLNWRPMRHLAVKLFIRSYQNTYFNEDGRGGIHVTYAF